MTDLTLSALALIQQSKEGAELPFWLSMTQTWSEIIRNTLLALAALVGAIWALYVFVLGRNTTANVQIDYAMKDVLALVDDEKLAVVTVKLKNTGRTQVFKVNKTKGTQTFTKGYGCTVTITPIVVLSPAGVEPYQIPLSSIDERNRPYTRKWRILENLNDLQPDEEAVEDFSFAWSDSLSFKSNTPVFKIEVRFVGSEALTLWGRRFYTREPRIWTSRGFVEACMSQEKRAMEKP
jgi:hypothetical protein